MSTILKALRRLEEDKRAQAAMSLDEAVVHPAGSPPGRGVASLIAMWAILLLGIAALMWATSALWLPGGESPEPVQAAATPTRVAPPPAAGIPIEAAPRPPPTTPVPIRASSRASSQAPSQPGRIETVDDPTEVRREMQRLVGASQEPPDPTPATKAAPVQRIARAAPAPAVVPAPVSAAPAEPDPEPVKASVGPVEIVERKAPPSVSVLQISWHPKPERRAAIFQIEGESETVRAREGGHVGGFTIAEIGISEVELVRDGVAVWRRVGTN